MPSVSINQRRAGAMLARLFVCMSALVAALLLSSAPAAQAAELATPRLKGTDPVSSYESPAMTTAPLVFGEAEPSEEVIKSVLGPGGAIRRGIVVDHPTEHPEYEILIFAGAGCEGQPLAGQGSAEDFEGAGIQVSVPADAKTALSAWQVDPAESGPHSKCSEPFFYWEGSVPFEAGPGGEGGSGGGGGSAPGQAQEGVGAATPAGAGKPAPPRLHMSPRARANDNSPLVAGSAPDGASVLVFGGAACAGAPLARGSAGQLAGGLQVGVADNATATFSAVAVAGQRSDCSAPVTYVEDSTPPRTRITMAPGAKTRKRKAVLRFADITDDPPGTTFRCRVLKGRWRPCSSPLRLRHLRLRRYVVRVRATDVAGNVEADVVKRRFKVVRHP